MCVFACVRVYVCARAHQNLLLALLATGNLDLMHCTHTHAHTHGKRWLHSRCNATYLCRRNFADPPNQACTPGARICTSTLAALAPALATSVISARVGLGLLVMDSSMCRAMMSGLPAICTAQIMWARTCVQIGACERASTHAELAEVTRGQVEAEMRRSGGVRSSCNTNITHMLTPTP